MTVATTTGGAGEGFSPREIEIIDQRIRKHFKTDAMRQGVVVSRDTTGPGARVVMAGDTVATEVMVLGSAYCREGDWVVLGLAGTDWYVLNSFAAPAYGEASKVSYGISPTTGALTSSSYVDLTEFGTLTFTKFFDATFVRIAMSASAFVSVSGTEVRWAVRFTPVDSSTTATPSINADLTMNSQFYNTANFHLGNYYQRRPIDIPAGQYTVSVRWRRSSGTGNVNADSGDVYFLELDERVRSSVPIL